jgi:hypothetical protein
MTTNNLFIKAEWVSTGKKWADTVVPRAKILRLGPQDMVLTGSDSLKYQHAQQPQTSTSIIPGPPFVPLLPQTCTRRARRRFFFFFFFEISFYL